MFSQVDKFKNGTIGLPNFYELYNILMEQPTVNEEFKAYSTELAKLAGASCLAVADLLQELYERQGPARVFHRRPAPERRVRLNDQQHHQALWQGQQSQRVAGRRALHVTLSLIRPSQFVEYLHSIENTIWNSSCNAIHQDMTRPLAHYFISSSHNTLARAFAALALIRATGT